MCGIAGFFSNEAVAPQTPERMLGVLRRRGPDAQHSVLWDGSFARTQGGACNALLHARLSIIDPRPEADQPMANEAGDIWICYNGEVYDWAGHAAELKALGYNFRNRSDTEFILHAYEAWGIDCLAKLRGMFAFTILDLRRRTVWLVRDRMGLKPLVYTAFDGKLAFGSTVRSVLPFLPPSKRAFSPESIDAFLAHRYIPAPRTVFSAVNRLENGHYLRFDLDSRKLEKVRYWHPKPLSGDWLETLDQAVEMRTVADRPLGVFLSGGIDSTVIASRLARAGPSGHAYLYGRISRLADGRERTGQADCRPAALAKPCHCDPGGHRARFRSHRCGSGRAFRRSEQRAQLVSRAGNDQPRQGRAGR